jgi:excisionase family DNA binding protein
MLPKPRRPREKRIVELPRVTYTIAEFCEITGMGRATLLRSIDDGSLRTVKVGTRRLILAPSLATTRDNKCPRPFGFGKAKENTGQSGGRSAGRR